MAGRPRTQWTAAELQTIVALRRAGEPIRVIEVATGLGRCVIWEKLRELGIPCPPRRKSIPRPFDPADSREWTEAELDAMIAEQRRCLPSWWEHDVRMMQIEDATLEHLSAGACRELATATQRGRNWRRRAGL